MADGTMTALDELLGDPIVQMVMARDGMRPEDFRKMLERDRRLAEKRMMPPAHVIAAGTRCSLAC